MLKLFVLDNMPAGIKKYRIIDPHVNLQKQYKNNVHVTFGNKSDLFKEDFNYDLLFVHAALSFNDNRTIDKIMSLKSQGVKLIVDIDDDWKLNTDHAIYKTYIKEKYGVKIINFIKKANLVTCANENMRKKIADYNKNVTLLKNCANKSEKQFVEARQKIKTDYFKAGYATGSSHYADVKLLKNLNNIKNFQMCLAGFDNRMVQPDGKIIESERKTIWNKYEDFLTVNYSKISKEYFEHLTIGVNKHEFKGIDNEPYRRIWTKPINTYISSYSYFNTALAPLVNNSFNNMKSELKLIEAGNSKTSIICSDIPLYNNIITHGKNGLLVKEKKSHKDWVKNIKLLKDNPNMNEDLTEKLYETIQEKFNYDFYTEKRYNVYSSLFTG